MNKIKKISLCMMLMPNLFAAQSELSLGRCCVAFGFAYLAIKGVTSIVIKRPEIPIFNRLCVLTSVSALVALIYDYPVETPYMYMESAMFGAIKGMKYIASAPFVVGGAVGNSIGAVGNSVMSCDSNFIWGSAMCLGIGLTAWYCRKKYQKPPRTITQYVDAKCNHGQQLNELAQARKELQTKDLQLSCKAKLIDTLQSSLDQSQSKVARLELQLQGEQPGYLPIPSAPSPSLSPVPGT